MTDHDTDVWSFAGPPVWGPLERFCEVMSGAVPLVGTPVSADHFMWMGHAVGVLADGVERFGPVADGLTIEAYKHCDSRRYLHLDHAGHAYRWKGASNGAGIFTHCSTPIAELRRVYES